MTALGLAKAVAILLPLAYAAGVLAMYLLQDGLLYAPDTRRIPPHAAGLSEADEVTIDTADGQRLVAWYTPAPDGRPTILFLHGNGGAISDRAGRYVHYTMARYGVLFLSYRGFGGSTGKPTERGLLADAEAAYDWLAARGVASARIALVGESMGTGIAAILATRRPVAALALEAPYSSIADVAADRYWWLPVRPLIKNTMDAAAAMPAVRAPVLMLHGDRDPIIPIAFGEKLFDRANQPKRFVVLPGADHFIFTPETFDRELAFFDEALGSRPVAQ